MTPIDPHRRALLAAGCAAWLAVAGGPGWSAGELTPAVEGDGVVWEENLGTAMAHCAKAGKPVFISFSTRKGGNPDAPFY